MNKYVVFDFDGTLVDSKAVFITAFNQLADKYRFKRIEPDNIGYLRQLSMHERIRALQVPYYKLPQLTSEFIQLYKQSLHHLYFIDGMADVLQQLNSSGYKTAIVSSNAVASIRLFLQHNNITHINDIYSSSRLFGKDKAIQRFLRTNGLRPADIIYVGDEQRDIIACKRTDVRIIWVAWGFELEEKVRGSQPNFTAYAPTDILPIVSANLI
jgi:phosphoglycolate phosphatase